MRWAVLMGIATFAIFTGAIPAAVPRFPSIAAFALTSAPQGGWTWFNQPNAIHAGDRTHLGWITGVGHPMAAHYDHTTDTLSTPQRLYPADVFEVDDHDDPALLRRSSDGRILAYYSVHFGNDQYVDVSTDPDDASAWDGPTNIGGDINAGTTTYMCPVELPDGSIRVFFRDHYDGVNPEWAYADSADGETFSGHTSLLRDSGKFHYMKPIRDGDRVHFVASGHPAYDDPASIYHFYWEGGSYYQSDGTLIASALPLDTSDLTLAYDGSTTPGWLWDIAVDDGSPVIAFATFPDGDGAEHRYQYARWTGSSWDTQEVADGGGAVIESGIEVFYSGGIAIDRLDSRIVYYSSDAGGSFDIFRGVTLDGGATWTTEAVTSDATKDIRPKAVQSPDPSLRVVWMRGTYTDYTDFSVATWGAGE